MKHLGRGLLSSITVLSLLLLLATLLFWTRGRWSVDRFDASVVTGKIPFPAIRTGDGQVVNDSGQAQHGYLLRGLSGGGGLWVEIVRRRCAMRTAFHHTGYSKIGGAQAFFDKVFTRDANPICRNFGFPDCALPAGRTAFFSSMSPSISGPGSLPPSPRFCPRWRCFAGTPPGVAACSLPALAPLWLRPPRHADSLPRMRDGGSPGWEDFPLARRPSLQWHCIRWQACLKAVIT